MPLSFYYPIGSLATLLMCVQTLLVLGGLSKGGGDSVRLMTVEQVNAFITL